MVKVDSLPLSAEVTGQGAACRIFIKSRRTVSVKTPEEKDLSMVEEQIIVVWGSWKEP